MNSGKILLGVLAGVAVGAVAGILLAPERGSDTRKMISRKSDAYAEKLGTQFKGFIEGMTNKFEAMTEEAADVARNGSAKVQKEMDYLTGQKKA